MDAPLQWLERLRWGTALAQGALVATVAFGHAPSWPLTPMLAVMTVGLVSNAILAWARRTIHVSNGAVVALLVLDTVLLTVLLVVTGGTSSPFSLMYLVPVISASFALPPSAAWILVAVTGTAYGSLFLFGPAPAHHHGPSEMQAHILGMFFAYGFTAPLLVLALTRISLLRAEAEERVVEALQMQARTRHLASLATLAAGAAHELSSPLSTIMLVAKELERGAKSDHDREDLVLIREEVLRCREILTELSADAGAGMGEVEHEVDVAALVEKAVERGRFDPLDVQIDGESVGVTLPSRLFIQILRRLLGNARDACDSEQTITLNVGIDPEKVTLEVVDEGQGMTPEVLAQCTDPFFSTKPEGEGTGLGLFFVHSVVQHYGGTLHFQASPKRGTTATVVLPSSLETPS